jgi:hypothetical protein
MPTEQEYEIKAKALNHADLLALWGEIENRATPEWGSGKAFEYLILRAFELEEAAVQYPYRISMQDEIVEQLDGAVHVDGISAIVESKDLDDDSRVNIEPIAKLRNQLLRRPSTTVGMIFSRTGFTDPAMILSQYLSPQTILIWNGAEIEYALQQRKFRKGLTVKYRMAVQRGQNDFSILTPGVLL